MDGKFLERFMGDQKITFVFAADILAENVAGYNPGQVDINLTPLVRTSKTMEDLPDYGGIDETERFVAVLHEFAHEIYFNSKKSGLVMTNWQRTKFLMRPTFREKPKESFADAFYLYLMWRDYIERFPILYEILEEDINCPPIEGFEMPDSVRSMLTKPYKGK
jgi:hypothetical protein